MKNKFIYIILFVILVVGLIYPVDTLAVCYDSSNFAACSTPGQKHCPAGSTYVCCDDLHDCGSPAAQPPKAGTLVDFNSLIQGMGGKIPQMTDMGAIMSNIMPLIFGITGFALFLFLIAAGFRYLTSSGDPKKLEGAKGQLTSAIIGFVLIFAAYWIAQMVNYIFKLNAGL